MVYYHPTPWFIKDKKGYNNLTTYISTLKKLLETINDSLKEYGADKINTVDGHLPRSLTSWTVCADIDRNIFVAKVGHQHNFNNFIYP